jgi:hypothetical protein
MASFTTPLASYATQTFTPDGLVLDFSNVLSEGITLASGQANVPRGAVLGQITMGAVTVAAKAGGNTGNGVFTLDVTTPLLANANKGGAGVYTVRCITAGTNSATFRVADPQGVLLGDFSYNGSGASGAFADRIKFTITDGSTDFIVGDGFDVTVAAGSGQYVLSLAAAVDGSQVPMCILVEATDATSGAVATIGYFRGRFAQAAVTLGAGQTIAGILEGLREKGIDLVSTIA